MPHKLTKREVILMKKCLVYEDMMAKLEKQLITQTKELEALKKVEKRLHHDKMVTQLEHQLAEQNQELKTLRKMKETLAPLLTLAGVPDKKAA